MGNMCSCKRGGAGEASKEASHQAAVVAEREAKEAERRQTERVQKMQTAGKEALRTLQSSKALDRAETNRREKIISARQHLGLHDEQSYESSSSNLPGDE